MKAILIIVGLFMAANSAFANETQVDRYPKMAKLYGYMPTQDGFDILVKSSGCTSIKSFELVLKESYPMQVDVLRMRQDKCRMREHLTVVSFKYKELGMTGAEKFFITNGLQVTFVDELILRPRPKKED